MTEGNEENTTTVLDGIRTGGSNVVVMAEARLRASLEALSRGAFKEALHRLAEAEQRIAALVQAEDNLGVFSKHHAVRGSEVAEGMLLVGHGRVTSGPRSVKDPSAGADVLEVELDNEQTVRFYAEHELLVSVE